MPGAVLNPSARTLLIALALGAALLLAREPAWAANTVQLAAVVPAGKTKTVRLRRLPLEAVIAVRVRSDGNLQVALVSGAQLKSSRPQALFRGALERTLTFQVVVPAAGDYYLVLDNRGGKQPVKTQTTISANKPPSGSSSPGSSSPGSPSPGPSSPGVSPPKGSPREAPRLRQLDEVRAPAGAGGYSPRPAKARMSPR